MKLKQNYSFRSLAVLFDNCETTVRNYFHNTISLLSTALKCIIYWPTKDENLSNMPNCFKKYQNTAVVLDCTEIPVEKTNCLKCRIRTYSYYKSTHTIKVLIGVTPSGSISYVSSTYGGRTSDKAIFNNENINKLIPHIDAVMVDKGFHIEGECMKHDIQLIRPPFLRKGKQLSQLDAEQTAQIARARVHVERTIQRIKQYSILCQKIEWEMLPYVDDIVTVVCALVNLSKPILSQDKFL